MTIVKYKEIMYDNKIIEPVVSLTGIDSERILLHILSDNNSKEQWEATTSIKPILKTVEITLRKEFRGAHIVFHIGKAKRSNPLRAIKLTMSSGANLSLSDISEMSMALIEASSVRLNLILALNKLERYDKF